MRALTRSNFIRIDFDEIKILIAGAESESMPSEFIFRIKTSESLFFYQSVTTRKPFLQRFKKKEFFDIE